jgi:hypothetical protein
MGTSVKWFKQTGSDFVSYGVIVRGNKAIVFTSFDESIKGKAVMKSINGWFPAPIAIDKSEIPPKITAKIEARL